MNTKKKHMKPLRFIKKYGRTIIGVTLIAIVVFCSIFAPFLTQWDPDEMDLANAKQTPNSEHIMGTDFFGEEELTEVYVMPISDFDKWLAQETPYLMTTPKRDKLYACPADARTAQKEDGRKD